MRAPTFGAARGTAAPKAALDAITAGARDLAASFYRGTGHELRALGVGVDDPTFARVALLHAERSAGAVTAEELEAQGFVDLEIDGLRLRVVAERALGAP